MLRLKYQLVCDDVRIENNSKLLIVGLYLDTIVVQEPIPQGLPITLLHVYEADSPAFYTVNVRLGDGQLNHVQLDVKQPGVVAGITKVIARFERDGIYHATGSGENVESFDRSFNVIMLKEKD